MPNLKQTLSHIILGKKGGETRLQIIELLKERPYNLNQLAKELTLNYRTIKHHIKILEDHDLITPSKGGRYGEVYFLTETMEANIGILTELTEKLRSLTSSPKFYQTVIEKTSDAIIIIDTDGDVLFLNPGAEKLYGYRMPDTVGTELSIFRSGKILNAIRSRAGGKRKFGLQEAKAYTKSGNEIFVDLTADEISDQNGNVVAYILLSRDITAQKSARAEIERLASFLSLNPNPVFEVGSDGAVKYSNDGTVRTLESIGANSDISRFFPPDIREILGMLSRGRNVNLVREIRIESAVFYLTIHVMPKLGTVRFYAMDITELKRMEEALIAKELKFRVAADFAYDWEYWIDLHNRFVYMSPSCKRITTYAREEFIDNPALLLDIVHPDDRERVEEHFRDETRYEELYEFEFRIIDRDGQVRWIGHACRPVTDAKGEPLGCRVSNREITKRRKAQYALRESEERFRVITEMMPSMVFVSRKSDNSILFTNQILDITYGYNKGELIGQIVQTLFYNSQDETAVNEEVGRHGIMLNREIQGKRSDGTPIWVLASVRKIYYMGEPAMLGTLYDITRRKI